MAGLERILWNNVNYNPDTELIKAAINAEANSGPLGALARLTSGLSGAIDNKIEFDKSEQDLLNKRLNYDKDLFSFNKEKTAYERQEEFRKLAESPEWQAAMRDFSTKLYGARTPQETQQILAEFQQQFGRPLSYEELDAYEKTRAAGWGTAADWMKTQTYNEAQRASAFASRASGMNSLMEAREKEQKLRATEAWNKYLVDNNGSVSNEGIQKFIAENPNVAPYVNDFLKKAVEFNTNSSVYDKTMGEAAIDRDLATIWSQANERARNEFSSDLLSFNQGKLSNGDIRRFAEHYFVGNDAVIDYARRHPTEFMTYLTNKTKELTIGSSSVVDAEFNAELAARRLAIKDRDNITIPINGKTAINIKASEVVQGDADDAYIDKVLEGINASSSQNRDKDVGAVNKNTLLQVINQTRAEVANQAKGAYTDSEIETAIKVAIESGLLGITRNGNVWYLNPVLSPFQPGKNLNDLGNGQFFAERKELRAGINAILNNIKNIKNTGSAVLNAYASLTTAEKDYEKNKYIGVGSAQEKASRYKNQKANTEPYFKWDGYTPYPNEEEIDYVKEFSSKKEEERKEGGEKGGGDKTGGNAARRLADEAIRNAGSSGETPKETPEVSPENTARDKRLEKINKEIDELSSKSLTKKESLRLASLKRERDELNKEKSFPSVSGKLSNKEPEEESQQPSSSSYDKALKAAEQAANSLYANDFWDVKPEDFKNSPEPKREKSSSTPQPVITVTPPLPPSTPTPISDSTVFDARLEQASTPIDSKKQMQYYTRIAELENELNDLSSEERESFWRTAPIQQKISNLERLLEEEELTSDIARQTAATQFRTGVLEKRSQDFTEKAKEPAQRARNTTTHPATASGVKYLEKRNPAAVKQDKMQSLQKRIDDIITSPINRTVNSKELARLQANQEDLLKELYADAQERIKYLREYRYRLRKLYAKSEQKLTSKNPRAKASVQLDIATTEEAIRRILNGEKI